MLYIQIITNINIIKKLKKPCLKITSFQDHRASLLPSSLYLKRDCELKRGALGLSQTGASISYASGLQR